MLVDVREVLAIVVEVVLVLGATVLLVVYTKGGRWVLSRIVASAGERLSADAIRTAGMKHAIETEKLKLAQEVSRRRLARFDEIAAMLSPTAALSLPAMATHFGSFHFYLLNRELTSVARLLAVSADRQQVEPIVDALLEAAVTVNDCASGVPGAGEWPKGAEDNFLDAYVQYAMALERLNCAADWAAYRRIETYVDQPTPPNADGYDSDLGAFLKFRSPSKRSDERRQSPA